MPVSLSSLPSWSRLPACALLLCSLLLAGCAGVKVGSIQPADYLSQRRSDVLTSGELSPATQETLRVMGQDLKPCLADAPACRLLVADSGGLSDEQRLSALAELWTQQALALQQESPRQRTTPEIDAWLEAARHAYAYLFFTPRKPAERAFEDRQTQVRDYYNYAVQQAVTGLFDYSQAAQMTAIDQQLLPWGRWQLRPDLSGVWLPTDTAMPRELLPASSLTFKGLRNIYRRDGFGAELVAVFDSDEAAPDTDPNAPSGRPFQEAPYPAITVLMQFEGENLAQVLATQTVHIRLYDPYRFAEVSLARTEVPLAANFTSGYGLWLARSGFSTQALRTLLGRSNGLVRPKIYLMQPYDPSRRVIVMLHGLASSPEAWINVANEVLGDPTLRAQYQIWQIYYPTNAPLALNNRNIRQALQATFAHFDPQGQAPAGHNTTLIGHSMGGVLARLMVSTSGEAAWSELMRGSDLPSWERASLREDLGPFLQFTPLPSVSDAIFIAAPHRGTPFANQRLARWLSNLITLPFAMLEQVEGVARAMSKLAPRREDQSVVRIPNSIDNLSDQDEFVRVAARLPISPQVRYHSIIGNDTPALALEDSSDGIVPYASAHLAGAASEAIVASGHSVQEHPQAILEIRRILRSQLTGR